MASNGLTSAAAHRRSPAALRPHKGLLLVVLLLSFLLIAASPAAASKSLVHEPIPSAASGPRPTRQPTISSTTTVSSTAISVTDAGRDRTGLDPTSPFFKKLTVGISYSRQFALTYYGVVFAVVLAFALASWLPRLKRCARKNAGALYSNDGTDQTRGSERHLSTQLAVASDTLIPHRNDVAFTTTTNNEHTPLLKTYSPSEDCCSYTCRVSRALQSWLVKQPASLPLFRNRTMPSNATSVLITAFLAVNVFYLTYNVEFSVPMAFVLADRTGILFATNLPVLYVLSAKNQPLQPLIGYSYASLNIIHRRLGEWMCLLAGLHGILMVVVWATVLHPTGYTFVRFISDRVTIFGFATLVCYQLIFATSMASFRQKAYELFLACHIALQLGALGFLFLHHSRSRPYVGAAMAVWFVDRIVYRVLARTTSFDAALRVMADGKTVEVSIRVSLRQQGLLSKWLGLNTVQNGWKALDHVFLTVPALGRAHAAQAHPFSIASSAAMAPLSQKRQQHDGSAELRLVIRARDGFSRDLLEYARQHGSVRVHIDGPYGADSASRMLRHKDARVIVAGGSGIAVAWPLVHALVSEDEEALWRDQTNDIESLAVVATANGGLLSHVAKPTLLLWIVRTPEQYSWIDAAQLEKLGARYGVDVVLPPPTATAGAVRPNVAAIVHGWLTARAPDAAARVGLVCSGPDSLAADVRNECIPSLVRRGRRVDLEIEKYGW